MFFLLFSKEQTFTHTNLSTHSYIAFSIHFTTIHYTKEIKTVNTHMTAD